MTPRYQVLLCLFGVLLSVNPGCSRPQPQTAEIRGNVDEFATSIAQLGGQSNVQVDLTATGTTDEDLARIVFPDSVTEINLSRTKVTDEGLVHLKKVRNLMRVNLSGTRVSDAGVKHLRELPNLCFLELHNSLVSAHVQLELVKELIPRQSARVARKAESSPPRPAP